MARKLAKDVGLAAEMGSAHFGKLSIDGAKVRMNISRRKAMSCGRMSEGERPESEFRVLLDHEVVMDAAKHLWQARMAAKLGTVSGRAQYAGRKWLSEAPGFRRFSVHGLYKVQREWDLIWLVLNVKLMRRLQAA